MLHKLLNLTRSCFAVDAETTGTDTQSDRIVEIGFQEWTADGMVKSWSSRVNPGIPIPPAATAVHQITDADMLKCQKCGMGRMDTDRHVHLGDDAHEFVPAYTFKQLAPNLAKGLVDCDYAGQNIRFDLRILAAEFARAGVQWSYAGSRIIDSGKLEQLAVPRSLSHLHEKYTGAKHDGAHGALSDVRAAATVITKQLETHDTLPRDLDALHNLSWPGYIDSDGKFTMVSGVATVMFGKYRGKPMRAVDRDYWTWMSSAKSEFSDEIKRIANDAARGVFTEEKKA